MVQDQAAPLPDLEMLEQLPVAVFVLTADGHPFYSNQVARDLLGAGIDQTTGADDLGVRYSAYRAGTDEVYPSAEMPVVRALAGFRTTINDMELDRPGGRVTLEVHGAPVRDSGGNVLYGLGVFQDITERVDSASLIQSLVRRSESMLSASEEGMFSLDERGLCTYVNRHTEEMLGIKRVAMAGWSIHEAVHSHASEDARHGVAECPLQLVVKARVPAFGLDTFWRTDGTAAGVRYSSIPAERTNDGTVVIFRSSDSGRESEEAARSAIELRNAIANQEFVLFYQPKVDLRTGTCWGAEALIRWQHPERGLLFPDSFIPLAERCGVIVDITKWVLEEAVRQRREWQDQGCHVVISVNLSPESLADSSIVEVARSALEKNGVLARAIEVELTETAVMENPAQAVQTLSKLGALGIASAIDDFGTGFSSLVYLRELPVETIKIDRSFVMAMDTSDKDTAIVRSTITLAHSLGKKVVAEGVETAAAAELLLHLGCATGQGYYWSRPVPAAGFLAWLTDFRLAPRAAPALLARRMDDHMAVPLLDANRAMLRATDAAEIRAALVTLVTSLGGSVAPADDQVAGALHHDLALGEENTLVPVAQPGSLARRLIEQALPEAIADAELAMGRMRDH
jgi:PAS domain S-box-containing protein